MLTNISEGKARTGEMSFFDKVFMADIAFAAAQAKQAYEKIMYRDALRIGYFELTNQRSKYVLACGEFPSSPSVPPFLSRVRILR